MVTKIVTAWRQAYPIKLYQLIGVIVAITLTWAAGIYGVRSYFLRDQERTCALAAESRLDLRTVILGIYDAIEVDEANDLVQQLRLQLNLTHPEMSFTQCMDQRYHR